MTVVTIVGNPRPESRTLGVASALGRRAALAMQADHHIVDLARLGPRLLDPGDEAVTNELERLRKAELAIIACPTYKASFTGILKLLLDRIPGGALRGVVAIPLMTGGAAVHSLAVEVHLRPVLLELGTTLPTPGLFVLESQLPDIDSVLDEWWSANGEPVLRLVGAGRVAASN